jgi:cell division protein ZapA
MSNVRLNIGGRDFSVACAPGEEQHIALLGRLVDDKLRTMGGIAGSSESRMLLFATLLLADELHESRHGGEPPPDQPRPQDSADIARLCAAIEAASGRLEKLAAELENAAAQA